MRNFEGRRVPPKDSGAPSNDGHLVYPPADHSTFDQHEKHVKGKDIDPETLIAIYEQSGEELPPELAEYIKKKETGN